MKKNRLTKQQQDFFTLLFEDMKGAVAFQKQNGKQFFTKLHEIKKVVNYLQDDEVNIYVAPFTFSRHNLINENALHSRAIWLDFDNAVDVEDIYSLLEEHELPSPNMIVFSGSPRSFHVYWIAEKPSSNIHLFLPKLVRMLGADAKAVNKNRVLRVPGTTNQKTRVKSHIVHLKKERYDTEELYEIFNSFLKMKIKPSYVPILKKEHVNKNFDTKQAIFDVVAASVIHEGQRNSAVGVLVQYLEYKNKSYVEILEYVRRVNLANFKPLCRDAELVRMVKGWYKRYDMNNLRCLTKGFADKHLEGLIEYYEPVKIVEKRQALILPANILHKSSKNLNGNDLYILFIIRKHGYMTITQLIDQVHLSRKTVFNCVNRLKAEEVIQDEKEGIRIVEHHKTKQYIAIDNLAIKLFEKKSISTAEFKVMCVLKLLNNLTKVTQQQIAKMCGIEDKRFLMRLLQKLEENQLISIDVIKRVNIYSLHF